MKKVFIVLLICFAIVLSFGSSPLIANDLLTKDKVFNGKTFYGSVQSAKNGKYWPFSISFYHMDNDKNKAVITFKVEPVRKKIISMPGEEDSFDKNH
jgi:hypothetical protein